MEQQSGIRYVLRTLLHGTLRGLTSNAYQAGSGKVQGVHTNAHAASA